MVKKNGVFKGGASRDLVSVIFYVRGCCKAEDKLFFCLLGIGHSNVLKMEQ